jgi:hypothetical protein
MPILYRAQTSLYDISFIPFELLFIYFFLKHEILLSQVFLFRTFSASDLGVLVYYVNNVSVSDEYCVVSLIFLSPRGSEAN